MVRKSVCFQCNNTGVVAAIKKGSAKGEVVMHLLRALWFFCAHFDIAITIEHLPEAQNCTADQLSHYNMHSLFLANPQAVLLPTPLPPELLQIVVAMSPDWTSQSAVHHSYHQGLATSTQKCYQAGQKRYLSFCSQARRTTPANVRTDPVDVRKSSCTGRPCPYVNQGLPVGSTELTHTSGASHPVYKGINPKTGTGHEGQY